MKHFRKLAGIFIRSLGFAIGLFIVVTEDLARLAISPVLAAIRAIGPWRRLEAFIVALPPYGALVALAVPELIFEPVKLLSLVWIAEGRILAGATLLFAAKLLGMAVILRLHALALPKLLSIGWYARIYMWVLATREQIYATVLGVPGVAFAIDAVRAYASAARAAAIFAYRRLTGRADPEREI
ncbi:MAG: hypothetical protein GC202_13755 [Alphaproteobacteria bacterium]|nr:hypothetical protein [Alphaproteobacteria bacterium]